MRIVLASEWFLPRLGGLELQLRDLAMQLAVAGHEVHVVTTTPADPNRQGGVQTGPVDLPDGVRVHRLDVPVLPLRRLRLPFTPGVVGAFGEAFRRISPDVVHGHASVLAPGVLAAGWAARRMELPTVVTFHSVLGRMRYLHRAADLLTGWAEWPGVASAVSRRVAAEVEWVMRDREVRVLPNGIDPEWWRVDPEPAETDVLRLVSVMRLEPRKRGEAILSVVAELRDRLASERDVRLTLIGDGTQRGALEERVRRLALGASVTFTGTLSRPEIRERFARSDVFVSASARESFGISVLEARAAGLPVVARSDGGVREIVEGGREGFLADSDEGLVQHLVRLARDRELVARIRSHNRSSPPRQSWERVVELNLAAYEDARRAVSPGVSSEPRGSW